MLIMKMKIVKRVLLSVLALQFAPHALCAQRAVNLTDIDKAQIIEYALTKMLSISEEDRTRVILAPPKRPAPICKATKPLCTESA
jgi:hypothetical protein